MDWTKKLFQENAREANAASQVSEVSTEHHKDLAAQRSMTLDKSGFHNGVGGARGKALSCIGRRHKRQAPSLGWEDPWGGRGNPLQYSWLRIPCKEEPEGYGPQGCKESETTEAT